MPAKNKNKILDDRSIIKSLTKVSKHGKENYLNADGKAISRIWFNKVHAFYEGYAVVELIFLKKLYYNYINPYGKLLSKKWFRYASDFSDSLGLVKLDENNFCFLTKKGEVWLNKHFYFARSFCEGFAAIQDKETLLFNFINQNGEFLSKEQYFSVSDFNNKIAIVSHKNTRKLNIIDTKGKILSPYFWFDYFSNFIGHYAIVQIGKHFNYIKRNGKLLFEKSNLIYCEHFYDGVARVQREDMLWNYIREDGTPLSPIWLKKLHLFHKGLARAQREDEFWNYLKITGAFLSAKEWFKQAKTFRNDIANVQRCDEFWYLLKSDGTILETIPFLNPITFYNGKARVQRIDGCYNILRLDGSYVYSSWYENYWDIT